MALGLLPPVVAELMMDIKEFSAGADRAEARMGALTESGSAAFGKLGKATVLGLAGIGIASLKMASDFETQMTRLYTAAGAPKAAVKASYGEVLKMASAVGETGTAMAEALYHPVSAGLDLATSLQVVKYSAEEAQISGASLDDTTYSLSSVMKAFNLDASNAHATMGLLNSIVGQGDMRFQDFNVSVKNWAPTAAQMGISIQSMGAALAYLTDRGNSAEEASTRVTMGLTMMAYPSHKAATILEGLGVASTDVTASSQAMTDTLRKAGIVQNQLATDLQQPDGIYVALTHLKTALNDAGVKGTEADAAISKIFGGGRSDKAILSLLQNLDGLKTKFADIGTGAGQFDQAWADTQTTFAFKMKQLGASAENVGITIGTTLIPMVESVVGWFAKHKAATETLAGVIAGVLTISLIRFAQTLTTSVLTSISKAVVAIKGLGTATATTAAQQDAANISAGGWAKGLGNSIPIIGGVVAGIFALGDYLAKVTGPAAQATSSVDEFTAALVKSRDNGPSAVKGLDSVSQMAQAMGSNVKGVSDPMAQMAIGLERLGRTTHLAQPELASLDTGLATMATNGNGRRAKEIVDQLAAATDSAGKKIFDVTALLPAYNNALKNNAAQQALTSSATKDTTDSTNTLVDSIQSITDAFTVMSGNISTSGALHAFQKDLLSVNDELSKNGTTFNESSLDGLKNMEAFRQAGDEILKYRDAQMKNGVATDQANKDAAGQTQQLLDVWEKLTGNKQAVDDYAKSLGLVPKDMLTTITVKEQGLDDAIAKMNQLNSLRIAAGQTVVGAVGGGRAALAGGGPVRGPGTSTSDSIPTDLSNGEFVIRAAAASSLGVPFLNALNATGSVPAAAASSSGYGGGSAYGNFSGVGVPVVNIYLDGQEISGLLRTQTLQYDQRNGGNGLALAGGGFR